MRINPAGIQVYQQQTETDRAKRMTRDQAPAKQAETTETTETTETSSTSSAHRSLSSVAVNAGEHVSKDNLSGEERAALDMLFSRFADNARFQSARQGVQSSEDVRPGQVIDIKV